MMFIVEITLNSSNAQFIKKNDIIIKQNEKNATEIMAVLAILFIRLITLIGYQ